MLWHHTGSLIDVSTGLGADSGKFGTLPRPAGPSAHIADVSYSYNAMSDPKNEEADWAWLDHWAQPDTQIAFLESTGYFPSSAKVVDDGVLSSELDRLRTAFDTARLLGAEMVISGCGSRHPSHFYGPHPDNHTAATRERLVASLRRAAPWAQDAGIVLALECHVTTALDTPEHIRDVVQAVDWSWVRANFDPVNLLGNFADVWHNAAAMRRMWQTLGACYTKSAHIKDVRADPELVVHISEAPPGHGRLDLDTFFDVVAQLGEDTAVIVEHLPAQQALAAIAYVKHAAEQRHFTFS